MFITAVCFTKPSIIIGIILEIYPKIAGSILCLFGEHNLSKPISYRERREKRAGIGKREGGAGSAGLVFHFCYLRALSICQNWPAGPVS